MMKLTELSSDNFNFHLKSLAQLGFVEKDPTGKYRLTAKGKEHANKIDTDTNTIERQPKVTVLLHIIKETDRGLELLVQQRLKQPFYGFWGIPTGKIRWGETIVETAQRELKEETGLDCTDPKFYGIHHKIDLSQETNEILEDKIFFEILCFNPTGEVIEDFPGGKNRFVTQAEIPTLGKLFVGVDIPIEDRLHQEFRVSEKQYFYTKDEY
jgi:8-oxo-dGTP pyrophosphatase MutT (NUDIX family)